MIDTQIKPVDNNFSLRANKSPKGARIISGYFACTEVPSKPLFEQGVEFIETLARGAFKNTLAKGEDVVMSLDHDMTQIFARLANGSLTLKEDSIGLWGEARLANTPEAESLWQNIQNELFMDCSFSFLVMDRDTTWGTNDEGIETRRINSIYKLSECAVISAYGAYEKPFMNARGEEFRSWGYRGLKQPTQPKRHIRKLTRNQVIRRRI